MAKSAHSTQWFILIGILILVTSCKKDRHVNTDPAACCGNGYVFITIGTDSVYIPNAFTPDGDGWNDQFYAMTTNNFTSTSLTISNDKDEVFDDGNGRWAWDGADNNGDELAEGTYNYTFIGVSGNGVSETINGKVCLMRTGNFCPQNRASCIMPSYFAGFDATTVIDSVGQSQYQPPFCN